MNKLYLVKKQLYEHKNDVQISFYPIVWSVASSTVEKEGMGVDLNEQQTD